MLVVHSPLELSAVVAKYREGHSSISMVPTMGALHEGHLSLFKIARHEADVVVASIFVNPLQFNDQSDFDKYPLQIERDMKLLESQQVDVLYAPTVEAMYGPKFSTRVVVDGLTDVFEGSSRPGHFSGVATVVAKLLSTCQPNVAIFGQKDFQQFAVIQRLVTDLDMPIRLVMAPTIREIDGLAMSSRNVRLSATARLEAATISQGLFAAQNLYAQGSIAATTIIETVREKIASSAAVIDYIEVLDGENLQPVSVVGNGCVILVAVNLEGVRLIDNLILQ